MIFCYWLEFQTILLIEFVLHKRHLSEIRAQKFQVFNNVAFVVCYPGFRHQK